MDSSHLYIRQRQGAVTIAQGNIGYAQYGRKQRRKSWRHATWSQQVQDMILNWTIKVVSVTYLENRGTHTEFRNPPVINCVWKQVSSYSIIVCNSTLFVRLLYLKCSQVHIRMENPLWLGRMIWEVFKYWSTTRWHNGK